MAGSEGIQSNHRIPDKVAQNFAHLFEEYLPGWNKDAPYNLDPRMSTSIAAAQLDLLKYNGAHKWISDQFLMMLMRNDVA